MEPDEKHVVPERVVERYLRTTLGRYAKGYRTEAAAALDLPEPERVLGAYINQGRARGVEVVFTERAIYQRSEEHTLRIPFEEIVGTEPPAVQKNKIASVTVVVRPGDKHAVWIDGGGSDPDALQLHQFLTNILAARARGAAF